MLRLAKNSIACVLLFALLFAKTGSVFPQENKVGTQETLLLAHDFVKLFYPELLNKNNRLSLCAVAPGDFDWQTLGGVFFVITRADVSPPDKIVSPEPVTTDHPILSGTMWFPPVPYGRVQEIRIFSDAAHQPQLAAIRRSVEAHPEWSNDQITAKLSEAGAKFGPSSKEAIVRAFPSASAEKLFGRLNNIEAEFSFPTRGAPGHFASASLIWTISADSTLPDNSHPRYTFEFEPFEGKLIYIQQSLGR